MTKDIIDDIYRLKMLPKPSYSRFKALAEKWIIQDGTKIGNHVRKKCAGELTALIEEIEK